MTGWMTPNEFMEWYISQKHPKPEEMARFMDNLKPTSIRWNDTDHLYEFQFTPSAQISFPDDLIGGDTEGMPEGWTRAAAQIRRQVVSGLLDQLLDMDKKQVLSHIESLLDQEDPKRAIDRAVAEALKASQERMNGE